jgi:hypothetical protein
MKAIKNKVKAPAMTRDEWEALPAAARYFIPWESARRPLTIKRVGPPTKATREGYRYFTEGRQ